MSRVCEICKKSSQKGNRITLVWGVKYRSIKHRKPNLRKTTILFDKTPKSVKICTTCLKSIKNGKIKGISYPVYGKKTTTDKRKISNEKESAQTQTKKKAKVGKSSVKVKKAS